MTSPLGKPMTHQEVDEAITRWQNGASLDATAVLLLVNIRDLLEKLARPHPPPGTGPP